MVIRFFPKYSPYQIDIYSPENKKHRKLLRCLHCNGGPGRIRTCDLLILVNVIIKHQMKKPYLSLLCLHYTIESKGNQQNNFVDEK